jgi:hypothetical protein
LAAPPANGIDVDYVPWPANGCNLAEARERTAERPAWQRRLNLSSYLEDNESNSPARAEFEAIEAEISANCLGHFKARRLIAYGGTNPGEAPKLIEPERWRQLSRIDWNASTVSEDRDGPAQLYVRVYPIVLAPCRTQVLDGLPLIDAVRQFALGDAEVMQFAREAVRLAEKSAKMLVKERVDFDSVNPWPLAFERWIMKVTIHPDPAKRNIFGPFGEPDPIEAVIAEEAWIHRYCAIITLLRTGELEARGIPGMTGSSESILRSIWSHEDFFFDLSAGNIVQDNPRSTGHRDWYVKRWLGVTLKTPRRATGDAQGASAGASTFHVKPTEFDGILSGTIEPSKRASRNGIARAEANIKDVTECGKWLVALMRKNPDNRITNKALWAEAKKQWPKLSENAFLTARAGAIKEAPAPKWAVPGAPKKSPN